MGIAAFSYPWPADTLAHLHANPAETLPLLFARAVPPLVGMLGLAAIVGAVTSSFSSSILSAGSMLSWNCLKRLMWPSLTVGQMARVIRLSILLFGAVAAAFALTVRSVQALWFFTSDLVFVLLFPQLVFALFDSKANRIGSMAAFAVSLVLRIGGGEPLLGIPHFISYPELFAGLVPVTAADWYDPGTGGMLFPFKALAAGAGMIVLPAVSRLSARWETPRPLRNPSTAEESLPAGEQLA
jgi:high affinity choline transporter 7